MIGEEKAMRALVAVLLVGLPALWLDGGPNGAFFAWGLACVALGMWTAGGRT